MKLSTCTTLALLAACVGCAIAAISACSEGNRDKAGNESQQTPGLTRDEVIPSIPRPGHAVIVIRDIGGFFEDCGCSGDAIGGLPRLPGVARFPEKLSWVFVGRLLTPNPKELTPAQLQLYKDNLQGLSDSTSSLLSELNSVYWVPDNDEIEMLEAAGVKTDALKAFRVATTHNPAIFGLDVSVGDRVSIHTIGVNLPLPSKDSRGREALVIAGWNGQSERAPIYASDIGALIPDNNKSLTSAEYVFDRITSSSSPIITSWNMPVKEDLQPMSRLEPFSKTA